MCLESSVSFWYFSFRKDFVWFLNLSLKVPPARPKYTLVIVSLWPCVTDALYTIDLVRQFPRRGQSSFTLQLHVFSRGVPFSFDFLITFSLWDLMIEFTFFMQL